VTRELPGSPDLVDLAAGARDAGHEVVLFERPMPDAVSLVGLGRAFEIVGGPDGARLEDATGAELDHEPGRPLAAASRLWQRLAASLGHAGLPGLPATGPLAVGGFAFRLDRQPQAAWAGFPTLLLRVPALSVVRIRGRSFATAIGPDADELLELPRPFAAPPARDLEVTPVRPPDEWVAAVAEAAARMRAGEAEKVVLAREVIARGDGPLTAGAVARSLRAAYPACFTYLLSGADGTAFVGASPELLVRRFGGVATAQPMAGSVARGGDDGEDRKLAAELSGSSKNRAEHEVAAEAVAAGLGPLSRRLVRPEVPEVVRFTNIQHLATTITAELAEPWPSVLELAGILHPTPAVGGRPLPAALRLIDDLERMERGWYAGGMGWIDGRGDGEICVALRCGLLWEDGARLYAGNGIMPDSDARAELEETELKLRALLGALAS
jgi:salicylate biosynthesis isochorismate synthase/menaquinone-specific isochorismate synthase